jgi:hypothetical protein
LNLAKTLAFQLLERIPEATPIPVVAMIGGVV